MSNDFDWVDVKEKEIKEERAKSYFDIVEGNNQFVLLTHCAPLAQVFDSSTKKYRIAEEGDTGTSIKGLCWVLQEGVIKQAKLPYTVVKAIRALQQNPDWEFALPFPHMLSLRAEGAGTKEVKYTLTASPKTIELTPSIMTELAKKPTPEEILEKIKGAKKVDAIVYPDEDINPDDMPS